MSFDEAKRDLGRRAKGQIKEKKPLENEK